MMLLMAYVCFTDLKSILMASRYSIFVFLATSTPATRAYWNSENAVSSHHYHRFAVCKAHVGLQRHYSWLCSALKTSNRCWWRRDIADVSFWPPAPPFGHAREYVSFPGEIGGLARHRGRFELCKAHRRARQVYWWAGCRYFGGCAPLRLNIGALPNEAKWY